MIGAPRPPCSPVGFFQELPAYSWLTPHPPSLCSPAGFKIPQEVPAYSWLKRGAADPGNRYNIRPGRHWDGVNRSNGFEKEMFKMLAARKANESEARAWAQADM